MNITNIEIQRIIAHEVVRASLMDDSPPYLSEELATINDNEKELIGNRIKTTMASGSHSVEVTVDDNTQGSPYDHITQMLDKNDEMFVQKSQHLANALSSAQTVGQIKSGLAIFIQGNCVIDGDKRRYIAVIKADSDEGLSKQTTDTGIIFRLVKDMLLGESQKLYKVAFFIEDNSPEPKKAEQANVRATEDFSIKIFDHLMQNSGDGNAATYFYKTFLKCRLAENASRKTKLFYQTAKDFINNLAIAQDDKVNLRGALITYLRSNKAIIEPRSFAKDYLPENQQDHFFKKCKDVGITQSITKDLSLLKGKLRRQSVKFSSKVTIYAAPEIFRDSVVIEKSIEGWTNVKIKGSIDDIP